MGTKLRNISGFSLDEVERQIEALPFKVEIKGINTFGSKWYVSFTLADGDYHASTVFPQKEESKPIKKTKKTKTTKRKVKA
jgi:hypothetical protein